MSPLLGRLILHNRETHLEPDVDAVAVGDVFEVIRGTGPREGECMGTATVAGFEADRVRLPTAIVPWTH